MGVGGFEGVNRACYVDRRGDRECVIACGMYVEPNLTYDIVVEIVRQG